MMSFGILLIVLAVVGVLLDMIFDFDMFVINLIAGAGFGGCILFLLGLFTHG